MMSNEKLQTTIRLNKETYKKVTEQAQKLGISVNAYISMILSKELSEKNK